MPQTYNYDNTGSVLRTRYSDLVRCTEKGVIKVVREMIDGRRGVGNGITSFGSTRHDMFYDESIKTGKLPECFRNALGVNWSVSMCEREIKNMVFPMVELYSTIDAWCPEERRIIDYKTASIDREMLSRDGESYLTRIRHKNELHYKNSRQHLCYALQLMMIGEKPEHASYLIEYWNSDRAISSNIECYGYQRIDINISFDDILSFRTNWLRERCERLMVARDIILRQG